MAYEKLKEQSVEPLLLVDLQYDAAEVIIDDFETLDVSGYGYATDVELNTSESVTGSSSVGFTHGLDSKIIKDFENIEGITPENDTSGVEADTTNFTQGTQSVKFQKSAGSSVATAIMFDIAPNIFPQDFNYMGTLAYNLWIDSDADAQKVSEAHIALFQNGTDFAYWKCQDMNFKKGWNVIRVDMAAPITASGGSYDGAKPIDQIKLEVYTTSSAHTMSNLRIDALRIYDGPDCYIQEDIETFQDATDWTASNGVASESVISRTGDKSVSLSKTSTAINYSYCLKSVVSQDYTKSGILKISVFITESDFAKVQYIKFQIRDNNNHHIHYFEAMKAGWNTVYINLRFPEETLGAIYAYEGFSNVDEIGIVVGTHNITDTLDGVIFDSISFPGENANEIDLPSGMLLRDTLTLSAGCATNLRIVEDLTNVNSRHALEFDCPSDLTFLNSFISSAAYDNTNSYQIDIRDSMIMSYDYKISSGDIGKVDAVRFGKGGAMIAQDDINSLEDELENGWNSQYFNVNRAYYGLTEPIALYFYVYRNNNTDVMTNVLYANLRTVKEDKHFYGKTQGSDLKRWYYDTGVFKPKFWHVSDSTMLLEPNANSFTKGNTARVENTDIVNEISVMQDYLLDLSGTKIITNNQGANRFSCEVYCENVGKVFLRVTDGSNIYTSSVNQGSGVCETLYVDFPAETIDTLEIVISADSGTVDFAKPKMVPWDFEQEPNYIVLDPMTSSRKWRKLQTVNSETFADGILSTVDIDHYNTKGLTFTKQSHSTNRGIYMATSIHTSLRQYQRILLDVFIKDSTALAKIKDTIDLNLIRGMDSSFVTSNDVGIKKDKTNHVLQVGWNTLSWYIPQKTKDDYIGAWYLYGSNAPRMIAIQIDNTNATDTFAAGDIVFSELRVQGYSPHRIIERFEDASEWVSSGGLVATVTDSDDYITGSGAVEIAAAGIVSGDQLYVSKDVNMNIRDIGKFLVNIKSEDWAGVDFMLITFHGGLGGSMQYFRNISAFPTGEFIPLALQNHVEFKYAGSTLYQYPSKNAQFIPIGVESISINIHFNAAVANFSCIFDQINAGNFIPLPYMEMMDIANYDITDPANNSMAITHAGSGYDSSTYMTVIKGNAASEVDINNKITYTYFNIIRNPKLYLPVWLSAATIGKLDHIDLLLEKSIGTGYSDFRQARVDIDDTMKADAWNLLEFDFENAPETGSCNMTNCDHLSIRIYTPGLHGFADLKLGAVMIEAQKLTHGGIVKNWNDSITSSKYVGYQLFVPDLEILGKMSTVTLAMNKNKDYSDTTFYRTLPNTLEVGWNDIKFDIVNDAFIDTYKTSDEFTNNIVSWKIYAESTDPLDNLEGLLIDRFATFTELEDEILRMSQIDIVGTSQGKYWEGRLLSVAPIKRALSEWKGLVELPSTKIEIADTDDRISGLYSDTYGASNFLNNEVNVRIGTPETTESEFLNLYKGYIDDISFKQKVATVKMSDTLSQYMLDLPTVMLDKAHWTAIDDSDNGKQCATIYGQVDSQFGALPMINVGDHDSNHYTQYVVAGHPCKSGTMSVFHDGVSVSSSDPRMGFGVNYSHNIGDGELYTSIFVPMVQDDSLDWQNPWEDSYTKSSIEYEPPEVISCNVHGKTTDGSISSPLIEDVTLVIYDLLTNELSIPRTRINTDNFQEIQVLLTQNNQIMAGAIVKNKNAEEVIAEMLLSHNLSMFIDKDGKICLYVFKAQKYDSESRLFTDEIDILEKSFVVNTGVSKLVNRVRFRCNFNFSEYHEDDENSWEYRDSVQDDESIVRVSKPMDWDDDFLDMHWIRESGPAEAIAIRLLQRYKNGRPNAKLILPLEAADLEIADKVRITHYDGVSLNRDSSTGVGWEEHLCIVKSIQHNPDNCTVTIEVDNVQDLASDCAFLGDTATFTQLWADILPDSSELGYLYLADKVTGKMSDATTDGHRLC